MRREEGRKEVGELNSFRPGSAPSLARPSYASVSLDYKEMNANRSPTREHEDVAWCMSKTTCETCVKGVSCIWCPEQGPNGGCFHGTSG